MAAGIYSAPEEIALDEHARDIGAEEENNIDRTD
jgi:hypothetical protein